MKKGIAHFFVISACLAFLSLQVESFWPFFLLLIVWLTYLYYFKQLSFSLYIALLASFFFFIAYIPQIPQTSPTSVESTTSTVSTIQGKIVSPIREGTNFFSFDFLLEDKDKKIRVYYFYDEEDKNEAISFPYTYGDRCRVEGKWEEVEGARNPFQFDYRRYFHEQGLSGQFVLENRESLQCAGQTSFLGKVYRLRDQWLHASQKGLQDDLWPWQQALLFGERRALEDETTELFARWGLSHLLAISGLHVGILMGFVYILSLRFFSFTKEQAQVLLLSFLPIYALFAGGQPSVLRATLMACLVLLLGFFRQRLMMTDIISLSFLFLIFIDPHMIYHIGFQFSFLVTYALVLSAKWFRQTSSKLWLLFKISFVSQMVIVPLQMYHFYHFQPLSILLNVVVVPYFSFFVMPLIVSTLSFPLLPLRIQNFLQGVFQKVHGSFLELLQYIDTKIQVIFLSGDVSLGMGVFYYILFFGMMVALEKKQKKAAFMYGIGITLWLNFLVFAPYFSDEGRVTMLDIGQGDAFVIELPYRQGVFLIDAGAKFHFSDQEPTDSIYRKILLPYLQGRGIREIDAIFVSHAHLDHHGSLRYILEDFPVKRIYISEFHEAEDPELQAWVKNKEVQIEQVEYGEVIEEEGISFTVLSPEQDYGDVNDNSLVLYTRFGQSSWLFTGDLTEKVEKIIAKKAGSLSVDVLKVAHHGSNSSSSEEFLEGIQPKYAWISVGRNNRYGHPSKEVLERLELGGVEVFRTDEMGAVQYIFTENKGRFHAFLEKVK